MRWTDAADLLSQLYQTVAVWCFLHQTEVDIIAVLAILWGLLEYRRYRRRERRRLHRIIRGMRMKNEERRLRQQARFEDALLDAALEMIADGDMHPADEKKWNQLFADRMGFTGMVPRKTKFAIKRAIRTRLRRMTKPDIPGPKPGVEEAVVPKPRRAIVMKSRYANGAGDGKQK